MPTKYSGDSTVSTGFRLYRNSDGQLLSWVQRRCENCGRFLSKNQNRFCSEHNKEQLYANERKYKTSSQTFKLYYQTYSYVRRHPELKIGQVF